MDLILLFLERDILPKEKSKAEKIWRKAHRFWLSEDRKLYKRSFSGPYLLCIHPYAKDHSWKSCMNGVVGFFSVLLGCHLRYYYCIGLGYLLRYWAQVFWVRELRSIQLELKLVRLVRTLCLVCQEHAYGRQNVVLVLCFCYRRNFSLVSAVKGTFLQFLP